MTKMIHTSTNVRGVNQDVAVFYSIQDEEPSTNTRFGVYAEAVFFEDQGCVLNEMSEDEIQELEQRLYLEVCAELRGDAEDRADWLYECEMDKRLEAKQ